jgi:hypothetical protein
MRFYYFKNSRPSYEALATVSAIAVADNLGKKSASADFWGRSSSLSNSNKYMPSTYIKVCRCKISQSGKKIVFVS